MYYPASSVIKKTEKGLLEHPALHHAVPTPPHLVTPIANRASSGQPYPDHLRTVEPQPSRQPQLSEKMPNVTEQPECEPPSPDLGLKQLPRGTNCDALLPAHATYKQGNRKERLEQQSKYLCPPQKKRASTRTFHRRSASSTVQPRKRIDHFKMYEEKKLWRLPKSWASSLEGTLPGSRLHSAFSELSVPVYAAVKGRASQIRSVPFTGESSDSSDNEETSRTPLSDRSSDRSPKATAHGVHRETSAESLLSDDYAVPPDAVSTTADTLSLDSLEPPPVLSRTHQAQQCVPLPVPPCQEEPPALPPEERAEKSGYLTKLGGKLKTWKRRWFVLANGTLRYYKAQSDVGRKPRGQISLDEVCRVTRAHGATTFEIATEKRSFYLTADCTSTMEEWVRVLQHVLRSRQLGGSHPGGEARPTVDGWVTKVKQHGHARRCWGALVGRTFLYFRTPADTSPLGQIPLREARVEEVLHLSDSSDTEEAEAGGAGLRPRGEQASSFTVALLPRNQSPTYLLFPTRQEMDAWLYHLTVVSAGENASGSQYEQLVSRLLEVDGDPGCVVWRHPLLLYAKEPLSQPLTSLASEELQAQAVRLFKSVQLFMGVPLESSGIDYHVALAQNALAQCLSCPALQNELFCQLIKQTSPHHHPGAAAPGALGGGLSQHRLGGVQQLLLCATQSLFLCDSSSEKGSPTGWQLLSLAVALFPPRNRTRWLLRRHLLRHSDSRSEPGQYASFCGRALERALRAGCPRECRPSRTEVLSILQRNPFHHSLPHSMPVHFLNGSYQVRGSPGPAARLPRRARISSTSRSALGSGGGWEGVLVGCTLAGLQIPLPPFPSRLKGGGVAISSHKPALSVLVGADRVPVVGFDGSTTVDEFIGTLTQEAGLRDPSQSGFALYSDDPIDKGVHHCLSLSTQRSDCLLADEAYHCGALKLCDVISRWEQALRERHLGKVENTRVICLTFRNRSLLLPFSPPHWSRVWVLLCPRWPTTGRGQEEGNGALPLGLPKLWLHNVGRGSLRGRSWPTPCGSPGKACVGVPGLKLFLRQQQKAETERERLLTAYALHGELMQGHFPLTHEMALEMAALMAQMEFGDGVRANKPQQQLLQQALDRFLPTQFHQPDSRSRQESALGERWCALRGRPVQDCVRIYLNCVRKWPLCGARLFAAKASMQGGGQRGTNTASSGSRDFLLLRPALEYLHQTEHAHCLPLVSLGRHIRSSSQGWGWWGLQGPRTEPLLLARPRDALGSDLHEPCPVLGSHLRCALPGGGAVHMKSKEQQSLWLAVSEDGISLLDCATLKQGTLRVGHFEGQTCLSTTTLGCVVGV
ncbi:hypothetical protein HPB48_016416 [Haemaphysalis longicornis]|uniref:Uncharacterized protein n=1 Tax=Haemaphysalis longicornis TaxID=44386 RepID=A0A9J6GWJ5_HAELO|nr:hypothetical protein HPB48_016416 [Haemaphysalis longicornis]